MSSLERPLSAQGELVFTNSAISDFLCVLSGRLEASSCRAARIATFQLLFISLFLPATILAQLRSSVAAIKMAHTGSGKIEVVLLSGVHDLQESLVRVATPIDTGNSKWAFAAADWNGDGIADLLAIKKDRTGSHKSEVYILSGASVFGQILLHANTELDETPEGWQFAVTDWDRDGKPDLVAIQKSGTTSHKTEIHILSGATNFDKSIFNGSIPLGETDDSWDFSLADWDKDGKPDLIATRKSGTTSHRTEVQVFSGATKFQNLILSTPTELDETNSNWTFVVSDWDGDGKPDLVAIQKSGSASQKTEITILSGATKFGNLIMDKPSVLPETNNSWAFVVYPPVMATRTPFYISKECGDLDNPFSSVFQISMPAHCLLDTYSLSETTGNGPRGHSECKSGNTLFVRLSISRQSGCWEFFGWHGPHSWIGIQPHLYGELTDSPDIPIRPCSPGGGRHTSASSAKWSQDYQIFNKSQ